MQNFTDIFENTIGQKATSIIKTALDEDGPDLTSLAVFSLEHQSSASLLAKEDITLAGLPLIPQILTIAFELLRPAPELPSTASTGFTGFTGFTWRPFKKEGEQLKKGEIIGEIAGSTLLLLRTERIILNFLSHLSGVATLTAKYVKELEGTNIKILDTRKTLPGLRALQKYAVLVGGGHNHRHNLQEMLMLKDNHIDEAGGITRAITKLRNAYSPCPPIVVECRNIKEVEEAVSCSPARIMLDNMDEATFAHAMALVPQSIEVEVSGGVTLANIKSPALTLAGSRKPDYISIGRITHSAPCADISMKFKTR